MSFPSHTHKHCVLCKKKRRANITLRTSYTRSQRRKNERAQHDLAKLYTQTLRAMQEEKSRNHCPAHEKCALTKTNITRGHGMSWSSHTNTACHARSKGEEALPCTREMRAHTDKKNKRALHVLAKPYTQTLRAMQAENARNIAMRTRNARSQRRKNERARHVLAAPCLWQLRLITNTRDRIDKNATGNRHITCWIPLVGCRNSEAEHTLHTTEEWINV